MHFDIETANRIQDLVPNSLSAGMTLQSLRGRYPEATFSTFGPSLAPYGLICDGIVFTFPFLNVLLFEVAEGSHMDPGSWYGDLEEQDGVGQVQDIKSIASGVCVLCPLVLALASNIRIQL